MGEITLEVGKIFQKWRTALAKAQRQESAWTELLNNFYNNFT